VSRSTRRPGAALLLALLILAACTGSSPSGSVECRAPVDGVVTITAANLAFDTACLALPADEAVTIRLVNNDTEPHNVTISTDSTKSTLLFAGDIINGGETIEYDVDPIPAGTYYFDCVVHPGMNGSVVVA
jgi:plastocyanin